MKNNKKPLYKQLECQYVGMELGIKKCAMLVMKKDKRETMERKEQPNQKKTKNRTLGEKKNIRQHQTDKRNRKKTCQNRNLQQKSHQRIE